MKNLLRLSALGLILLLPQIGSACTIPVFRYALERWELSTYDILVYHRGPLSADLQKTIKPWSDGASKANVEITLIDLDGKMTTAQRKLWEREGNKDAQAWMLVRLQSAGVKEASVWTGPCTKENVQQLILSPMRQAILSQLVRGSSAVCVMLTSDDVKEDEKQFALVTKQLSILEKRIKLPVQSDDGPKLRLPLPLKVSLPLLVLDRNDPNEAAFIRMLLATEEGLEKQKGPIVFPIFGRGRVLGGLYGADLNPNILSQAIEFLCRDCSCQVKELNPGVDLLLAADWNQLFDRMFEGKETVPLPMTLPTTLPKRVSATEKK